MFLRKNPLIFCFFSVGMRDKNAFLWYNDTDIITPWRKGALMREPMLFYTTVPILLGGAPKSVGRLAAIIYANHGIEPHWYGRGVGLLTAIYAKRHPLSLPFAESSDGVILHMLRDFEKHHRPLGGILCLIPCSESAEAFLERRKETLEECFVLLERPAPNADPLYGLVHGH